MSRDKRKLERRFREDFFWYKSLTEEDVYYTPLSVVGRPPANHPDILEAEERGWIKIDRKEIKSWRGNRYCLTYAYLTTEGRKIVGK